MQRLQQREYPAMETEKIITKMLKFTKLKPEDSWDLITLSSFDEVDAYASLQLVSEFEFKHRFVYKELGVLFERTFENILVDTNEMLQEFSITAQP